MTHPSDLDPLRFATITTNGFGPITSLFAVKEAAASCRLDQQGETYTLDPDGGFDDGPGGQHTHCFEEDER